MIYNVQLLIIKLGHISRSRAKRCVGFHI